MTELNLKSKVELRLESRFELGNACFDLKSKSGSTLVHTYIVTRQFQIETRLETNFELVNDCF